MAEVQAETAAAGGGPRRLSGAAQLEALAVLQLGNRFVWLAAGLALALILQLSVWQARYERFDTLTLMSHIMAAYEAALLAGALILALSLPALERRWRERYAAQPFNHGLAALAAVLTLIAGAVVLLLPVALLHRYPELMREDIVVPLLVLQRGLLLLLAALITYNFTLLLRYYARLPWWLCGILGLVWHVALGYTLTYLSFTTEGLRRLNDVFYYNQLWRYSESIPNLQREEIFHNIQQPYFGYALGAVILWLLTLALLGPGLSLATAKQRRP